MREAGNFAEDCVSPLELERDERASKMGYQISSLSLVFELTFS